MNIYTKTEISACTNESMSIACIRDDLVDILLVIPLLMVFWIFFPVLVSKFVHLTSLSSKCVARLRKAVCSLQQKISTIISINDWAPSKVCDVSFIIGYYSVKESNDWISG